MNSLTPTEIARAWKDEAFRNSLTDEQRAALPASPTIINELSDDELEVVAGGLEDSCQQGSCTDTCNKKSKMS